MHLARITIALSLALSCFACADLPGDAADDGEEEVSASTEAALTVRLEAPVATAEQKAALVAAYGLGELEVPATLLGDALSFFEEHKEHFDNKRYITVVDYGQHSGKKRFYLIDLETKTLERTVVAHGSGSDPNGDGMADSFGNTPNTNKTSLGYFRTAETYQGKHGYSLRLDGVSASNSAARSRAIVMHTASYVSEGRSVQGRSWGCLVVPPSKSRAIIDKVRGGSLIYAGRTL